VFQPACPGNAERGGGRGELVQMSVSRGGPEFRRRSGTPEQGSTRGEIGGKVPPTPPLRVGPAVKEEEAAGWGRRHGLRLNGRLGSGLLAGPVKEKKDFRN
jgi:hypothetical protein